MARSVLERSFWLDTVAPAGPAAQVSLPDRVDVAIVGAGFTGLSAALALAKRGASIAVLETHEAGWGASSRNGGMALTGLKRPVQWLVARFGARAARKLYDASIASIDFLERLVRDESIDCDFARSGHLEVACKRSHFDGFRETAECLERDFGRQVQIVEKQDLQGEVHSNAYHGGLLDELSAGLNPAGVDGDRTDGDVGIAGERAIAGAREQVRQRFRHLRFHYRRRWAFPGVSGSEIDALACFGNTPSRHSTRLARSRNAGAATMLP